MKYFHSFSENFLDFTPSCGLIFLHVNILYWQIQYSGRNEYSLENHVLKLPYNKVSTHETFKKRNKKSYVIKITSNLKISQIFKFHLNFLIFCM